MREISVAGLDKRLAAHGPGPGKTEQEYRERLDFELNVIEKMKFPGYFLIVADFVCSGPRRRAFRLGPAVVPALVRSSPIRRRSPISIPCAIICCSNALLNPERVSMPDFDIDFCQDRREEVIQYVQKKYGVEQVAQIITFVCSRRAPCCATLVAR